MPNFIPGTNQSYKQTYRIFSFFRNFHALHRSWLWFRHMPRHSSSYDGQTAPLFSWHKVSTTTLICLSDIFVRDSETIWLRDWLHDFRFAYSNLGYCALALIIEKVWSDHKVGWLVGLFRISSNSVHMIHSLSGFPPFLWSSCAISVVGSCRH